MKSEVTSPLRGFSPHYKNQGNLEDQLKLIYQQGDIIYNIDDLNSKADELTINAGDFLYHPAGIWHAVECQEDSKAINFSMKNQNMADFICSSLKHLLNSDHTLRQRIHFTSVDNLRAQLAESLEMSAIYLSSLTPESMAPNGILCPRYLFVDFDSEEQIETLASSDASSELKQDSKLMFNPLAMLMSADKIP